MPSKPLKTCSTPGCPNLASSGKCDACKAKGGSGGQRAPWRAQSQKWYGSYRWKEARRRYLIRHPLCVACEAAGRIEPATILDHIRPHRGDPRLFWDVSNWRVLCLACHNAKSAKEQQR
ncbi:MAG: HNH endonuclease [Planctomycetaceae bacterium]|nr:HNH endonuclease [Planctomycetaceae bacterium]